jgi:sialic acid synthase SpsE
MAEFRIGNRRIASKEKVYFLAEIGLNHNGDLDLATEMIRAAARTGAEGVKFQTYKSELLASPLKMPELYNIFKTSELDEKAHLYLRDICRDKGMNFISTPFDEESAEMLLSCGVDAFKIASGDLTNFPLMKTIASYNKPVIFSTGMGYMKEVIEAIDLLEKNGASCVIQLHCVSSYPPDETEMNIRVIKTMRESLGRDVGYSDHYIGDLAILSAVALGATFIEKHFTIDKNLPGPDQSLSADEVELKTIIERTRKLEIMLGDGEKKPSVKEESSREVARRGLYAAMDIKPGTCITRECLKIARPEGDTPASMIDTVIGMISIKEIPQGASLSMEYLSGAGEMAINSKMQGKESNKGT